MSSVKTFFSEEEKEKIVDAIKQAELQTSGEIRLHVESKCAIDPVKRATQLFHELNMHNTQLRNGVLFYLAVKTRHFAVVGDEGINSKVGDTFWTQIKEQTISDFKKEAFANGLINSILECGKQLKHFFPLQSNDKNELSNDISFE